MDEDKEQESLIHMRVSRELKGRWVALSRKEGMKLTDWIVKSVENSISEIQEVSSSDKE